MNYIETLWHIATGCSHSLSSCEHFCYKTQIASILHSFDTQFDAMEKLQFNPNTLNYPTTWEEPRLVKVAPYGDIFDLAYTSDQIRAVFKIIESSPQHIFHIETLNPERANKASDLLGWPSNLWVGTVLDSLDKLNKLVHHDSIPTLFRSVTFISNTEKLVLPSAKILRFTDLVITTKDQTELIEQAHSASIPTLLITKYHRPDESKQLDSTIFKINIDTTRQPITWNIAQLE